MQKKQTLTVNIPEPCNKPWKTMQPSGCGRFCTHCEKIVIDFTQMNDEEIVKILTAQKDHLPCGRFSNAQLNRPLMLNQQRKPFHVPAITTKVAAAFLLVPAFIQQSFAQGQQKPRTEQSAAPANNKPIILKGKISDAASGRPLVAMEISIDKLDYVEYSDKEGHFSFLLPGSLSNQEITIKANYQPTSSPETKETVIQPQTLLVSDGLSNKVLYLKRTKEIDISKQGSVVNMDEGDITGGVPIIHYPSLDDKGPGVTFTDEQKENNKANKPTFLQRIGRLFKRKNKTFRPANIKL